MYTSVISKRPSPSRFHLVLTGFLTAPPPPLLQSSLSLRCRSSVADISLGAGHPKSVVLCVLTSCGFLEWSLANASR